MNPLLRLETPSPGRRSSRLLLALLTLSLGAQAQAPTVTGTTPKANSYNAAPSTSVALTYSQAINPATAPNVRVFSSQAGGRKAGTATANGNTITVQPTGGFRPGETVSVTAPATVTSTGSTAAVPRVYQFTTQTAPAPNKYVTYRVAVGERPLGLVAADLDADGDVDVATLSVNYNGSNATISIRRNDGAAGFNSVYNVAGGTAASLAVTEFIPEYLAAGDVDNDGDLDLLAISNSTVNVLANNGQGGFALTQSVPVGNEPSQIRVADLNSDGNLDFATVDYSGVVKLCLNQGNSTFPLRPCRWAPARWP